MFENENPDSALYFYNQSLRLSESKGIKAQEAFSLLNIGRVYCTIGEHSKAMEYLLKALKISEFSDNKTIIFDCYLNIGNINSYQGNNNKAEEYYLMALKIGEKISKSPIEKTATDGRFKMSSCFGSLGNIEYLKNNYEKAVEYFIKALKIFEQLNQKKDISTTNMNIGNVYFSQGIYDKAITFYIKALKVFDELANKKGMAMCYINVGTIQSIQKNYLKAIEYYLNALKISEAIDYKKGMALCNLNIGLVYYELEKYELANEFYINALNNFELLGDKKGISACYHNIGLIHYKNNSYDNAIEYYLKALNIDKELEDKVGLSLVYGNLSEIHRVIAQSTKENKTEHFNKALKYGNMAYELAKSINSINSINVAAEKLYIAYKITGNYKKSIEYAEIFIATKDSMFSEEKTKSLAEMGAKYESEKRELTIQKLEKEQLLQNETIARKNAESKKQRILIFSFLAGFIIILVFSIFLYRLFIQKKLANVILFQQKEEISAQRDEIETQRDLVTVQKEHIEEIHKEVTDSINYAERIQRSFLATKELLDENLNSSLRGTASPELVSAKQSHFNNEDESNYFVFFKPKDVVSGDFYWAGKLHNGNFALATADSTGHGVPGAIMSILNISSLEKAIEQGICEPSEILNHTRKTIIERLKKDGSPEGGKDGMDASLICFDFETQKLTYSAANNPIWIVRPVTQSSGLLIEPEVRVTGEDASANFKPQPSNFKLFELSHDKMPIGKHDKDQISFTQHEFQLQKGDVIYTLTDGFQDQFGGPNGKKFLTKNVKKLLIDNCQLSMEEQKKIIENTLENWTNYNDSQYEQTDDITILGIRI